jgi:hypothetical protein
MPQLPKTDKGNRIAFVGPMGAGKTWYADYLVKYHGYTKLSLAGKLKSIAYELFGVQGKDGNDRVILQGIGSDMRKYDPQVWIKFLFNSIVRTYKQNKYRKIVVDDLRYENEAKYFRDNGFVLIRVETPEDIRSGRITRLYPNRPPEAVLHASETEQEGIVADYTIQGNDLGLAEDLSALLYELVDADAPAFMRK